MINGEQLKQAGFTQEEITAYVTANKPHLESAGFTGMEINQFFNTIPVDNKPIQEFTDKIIQKIPDEIGQKDFFEGEALKTALPKTGFQKFIKLFRPDFEKQRARAALSVTLAKETGLRPSAFEPSSATAFKQGLQQSVSGMLYKGKSPADLPFEVMNSLDTEDRLLIQAGMLLGDFPFMLAGGIIGAGTTGNPITAVGGAFALPQGLRKVLIDKYEKGEIKGTKDFLTRLKGAVYETLKGEAVGVATGAVGVSAAKFFKFPAELATMTTIGAALEREVPSPQDFVDGAILLGGLKGTAFIQRKLGTIYTEKNIKPDIMYREAVEDTRTYAEILSKNKDIPLEKAKIPKKIIPEKGAKKKVLEQIEIGGNVKKEKVTFNKVYTQFVDDLNPLAKAVKALAGKDKLAVEKDPYVLARLHRGWHGKAEHFLEFSPYEFKTGKNIGKSLKNILEPLKGDLDTFRAYAVSKRAIELSRRKIKTGINIKAAAEVVQKNRLKFEKTFQEIKEYQNHLLNYLKDSGLLNEKTIKVIKEANQDYVPFYRILDDVPQRFEKQTDFIAKSNLIKKIRGSEKLIVDPLESIIKNTYTIINLAEKNKVAESFIKLTESVGKSEFAEKIARPLKPIELSKAEIKKISKEMGATLKDEAFTIFRPLSIPLKENEIMVWREGKRQIFETTNELARTFKALDREQLSLVLKALSKPASWLRAGAILTPEFIARNPFRDQFSAFVYSKFNFIPFYNWGKGIASLAKKDIYYKEWLKSGAAQAALTSLDRKYLQKSIIDLERKGFFPTVWNEIKNPIQALRILSEITEFGTRIGEFKKGIKKGAKKEEAAFAAREVGLDFAKMGTQGRVLNSLIAFWNANVQGTDKLVRAFKTKPVQTSFKIFAGITLPSIVLAALNHKEEWYKDIPQWQKDLFWVFKTKHPLNPSKEVIWRIPKPFELGIIFGTIPERFVIWALNKDPEAFKGILDALGRGATPGLIPTVALPLLENFANRSVFLDRPIVPANREGLLPEYQYKQYTKEIVKAMSRILGSLPALKFNPNIAPVKIENLIRGYTAGLGTHILNLANFALTEAGILPARVDPSPTLADIPFVKAFVVRHPSGGAEPIQKFYKNYERFKKTIDTAQVLIKKEFNVDEAQKVLQGEKDLFDLTNFKNALSNAHKAISYININPNISKDEKRQLIDKLYYDMILIAKEANKTVKLIKGK